MEAPGNVHEAASIARHEHFCAGIFNTGNFLLQHGVRNFGIFDGEGSPEATALLCELEGYDFRALDLRQQTARFVRYAQFTEQMT